MQALIVICSLLIFGAATATAQSSLARRAFREGTRLAAEGEFRQALKAYQNAATADPDAGGEFGARLRYNLGVCHYRLGEFRAAKADLAAAVKLTDGLYAKAQYALGMAESALGDWREAERAFAAALQLEPANAEAWFDLAVVYLAEQNDEGAADAFRRSIEYGSVDAALGQNNLGVIMALRSDYEAAEAAFRAALELAGGSFAEAKANLELCRGLSRKSGELLAASGFKFVKRTASI